MRVIECSVRGEIEAALQVSIFLGRAVVCALAPPVASNGPRRAAGLIDSAQEKMATTS